MIRNVVRLAVIVSVLTYFSAAQHQHDAASHDHTAMEHRGQQGMGFDQQTTTHHFLLAKDGGSIQVTANSANDAAAVSQIHAHLKHIASEFQKGNFDIPGFVHAETPSGVPVMQERKSAIHYTYEEVPQGGRVCIVSSDIAAIHAVHDFLRYQITEHRTGDPLQVSSSGMK